MGHIVMPDELAEIIATHRAEFGGFVMEAEVVVPEEQPVEEEAVPSAKDDEADLGDAGKRALAAERKSARDALRRATEAEARLKDIEDAGKSELQKAQDAAAKAAADAEAAQLELSRERIARRHRLSDEDAELLSGSEEQMERVAARLSQRPDYDTPVDAPQRAKPVHGIDRVPETRNVPLRDRIAAAEADGNKALVGELKAMMLAPGQ